LERSSDGGEDARALFARRAFKRRVLIFGTLFFTIQKIPSLGCYYNALCTGDRLE